MFCSNIEKIGKIFYPQHSELFDFWILNYFSCACFPPKSKAATLFIFLFLQTLFSTILYQHGIN